MGYFATHYFELLATIAGLLNIYLAARNSMWNWLFGIIAVSLYLVIFFQVKLYADMSLQFIFLLMQFYGIYQWRYGGDQQSYLEIKRAPPKIYWLASINGLFLFSIIAYSLLHYTDSTTVYIDACTTTLSLIAQWMMSRKWLEHWFVWSIVNLISIDMYYYKNLYFTSALYGIYIVLCVMGYRLWQKNIFCYDAFPNAFHHPSDA